MFYIRKKTGRWINVNRALWLGFVQSGKMEKVDFCKEFAKKKLAKKRNINEQR